MKNIRGKEGIINLDGKLGSDSLILDVNEPDFYECIEDGIKSTVKILIDNGFATYSSCQGHDSLEYSCRNVVVILAEKEILPWKAMIADLNILNKFKKPITYAIVDYRENKKGFMILIGSIYNLSETLKKQSCLEKAIPNIKKSYYSKSLTNIIDFSDAHGHINIFSS